MPKRQNPNTEEKMTKIIKLNARENINTKSK